MSSVSKFDKSNAINFAKKVLRLKRKAAQNRIKLGISHSESLDQLAVKNGFANWSRLMMFSRQHEAQSELGQPPEITGDNSEVESSYFCAKDFFSSCQDQPSLVGEFISLGGQINELDEDFENQIMRTARRGQSLLLRELLNNGANPHQINRNGYAALNIAAKNGNTDCCELLIEHGVDVNKPSILGSTPLNDAACYGYFKTCQFLLEKGALMIYSKRRDFRSNVLCTAAMRGRLPLFKLFINHGIDVNVPQMTCGIKEWSPLMWATLNGDLEGVKKLIEFGADVNYVCELKGETALIQSAIDGKYEIFELLVKSGADKSILDNEGKSAYDRAAPGTPKRSWKMQIPWSPNEKLDNGRIRIREQY